MRFVCSEAKKKRRHIPENRYGRDLKTKSIQKQAMLFMRKELEIPRSLRFFLNCLDCSHFFYKKISTHLLTVLTNESIVKHVKGNTTINLWFFISRGGDCYEYQ